MMRLNGPADLLAYLEAVEHNLAEGDVGDAIHNAHSDLKELISHLKEPGKGVNPVTIPGVKPQTGYKANISIMRLWLETPAKAVNDGQQRAGVGVEPVYAEQQRDVTVVMWDGDPAKPNILQVIKIAEQDFIQALAQAFPLRELWVESGASKVNTDLLIKTLRGQS